MTIRPAYMRSLQDRHPEVCTAFLSRKLHELFPDDFDGSALVVFQRQLAKLEGHENPTDTDLELALVLRRHITELQVEATAAA